MFADYSFYTDAYCGSALLESDFKRLSVRAAAYLNRVTFGAAEEALAASAAPLPEPPPPDPPLARDVKLALCSVADAMLLNEHGGGVVGETVGKISVNYAAGVSSAGTDATRLFDAAALFLEGKLPLGMAPC